MRRNSNNATSLLKSELALREITYKNLSLLLESQGVYENEIQLKTKINRGTFSFEFAIHVFRAIGADKVYFSNRNGK